MFWERWSERIYMLNWLYPECCPVCLRPVMPKGVMVHPKCNCKLDRIKEPVCIKCGMPLAAEEEEYCPLCIREPNRGWDCGRSIFPYHSAVAKALQSVKTEGTEEFVRFFAKQMKLSQQKFIRQMAPECIVPVPLHPSKLRSRGFNQAELLAEALGKETGLPVRELLIKKKKTKDQKSLSRMQRTKNVKDAFAVDEEEIQKGIPASVLLLDDVCTTGSTLTACAGVLKTQGVARVSYICICAAEQINETDSRNKGGLYGR